MCHFLLLWNCWLMWRGNRKEKPRKLSLVRKKYRVRYALEIRWTTWTKHFCWNDVMNRWMPYAYTKRSFYKISSMQTAKGLRMKCASNRTAASSFFKWKKKYRTKLKTETISILRITFQCNKCQPLMYTHIHLFIRIHIALECMLKSAPIRIYLLWLWLKLLFRE